MTAPGVGDIKVWTGGAWVSIKAALPVIDPETLIGAPVSMGPFSIDPETTGFPPGGLVGGPDLSDPDYVAEDPQINELCEILLCKDCDMELGSAACGAQHAYLADHPLEHPLIKDQLQDYLRKMRWTEGRECTICSFSGQAVALATGDCGHVDIRDDQVLMSRAAWNGLTDKIIRMRTELARIEDEKDGTT